MKKLVPISFLKGFKSILDRLDTMETHLSYCVTMGLVNMLRPFQGKLTQRLIEIRIGSLHSSIYIVNEELKIKDL